MTRSRRAWEFVLLTGLVGVTISLVSSLVTATDAEAQLRAPSASDARATFFSGNVVTCSGAGFPLSTQVGSPSNTSGGDVNVQGTVATNAGTTQPGVGQEVNITIVGQDVVIDAVIVKGGVAYNQYTNASVLPPTLPAPQHYISPFNGGGNVPTISHWFVCYHVTTPPPSGTLTVEKGVIPPDGIPVTPLPTTFTVIVNCNDGNPAHEGVEITFGIFGGRAGTTPQLTGIPEGTVCTVVEQNSGAAGGVVSYTPTGADSPGVTITGGGGVVVGVVNNFSGVAVQRGTIHLTKTVVAVGDVTIPATFTANVTCDDGTAQAVTLPGAGGVGTPDVSVKALSLCLVEEDTSGLPAGWIVTYSVDGGPASATPPIVGPVQGNATVTVEITNDPTDATTTTTSTTTTVAPTTTAPSETTMTTSEPVSVLGEGTEPGGGSGSLPFTGIRGLALVVSGLASLVAGVALVAEARRRRPRSTD